jgi:hypothetical protein
MNCFRLEDLECLVVLEDLEDLVALVDLLYRCKSKVTLKRL